MAKKVSTSKVSAKKVNGRAPSRNESSRAESSRKGAARKGASRSSASRSGPLRRSLSHLGEIIQGDCVAELAKLDAGVADLVFADPPFNIGYDYDEYDDRKSSDDYLDWSKRWMSEVVRVLKDDGTFWLAIGDEYAAELKVLATRELGLTCRSWVVWYYTFGVHCHAKFTRSHAHMFYFVKDPKRFTFNDMAVRVPSARQLVYGDKRANPKGRVPDDTWMMTPVMPAEVPTYDGFVLRPQDIPDRFPPHGDTWFYSRVCGTFKERKGFHGCQMPEQLLGRIIKSCSRGLEDQGAIETEDHARREPDLVLDPFAGSGTTLAVAKKLGRRCLGIELSKEYAVQGRERLSSIQPGDPLDGPENPLTSAPNTKNGKIRTKDGRRVKRSATATIAPRSAKPGVNANADAKAAACTGERTLWE